LKVCPKNGLSLTIPHGIPISVGKEFLLKKRDWIIKQIKEKNRRLQKYYYLGYELQLVQEYCMNKRFHKIELSGNVLQITSPSSSQSSLNLIYEEWLKLKARKYIFERTKFLSEHYGFKFNKISIRGQKTRWGSCSRKGNLSFNFKLMQYSPDLIDYVLVHELCHLKEMNHSIRFWGLVQNIIPDYRERRNTLKKCLTD
jgi:predicted metal-dependent hydrolase